MKKGKMFLAGISLLVSLLSPGCGKEAEDYTVGNAALEYYDISATREELFDGQGKGEGHGILAGMQYYKGEPVQIWKLFEEEKSSIYLCRLDGSRELLAEGLQEEDVTARWYLDEEGGIYCWKHSLGMGQEDGAPYIIKLDEEGRKLFRRELEQGMLLRDLCRLEDGSLLLLLQEGRDGEMKLAEMDAESGALSEKPGVSLGQSFYSKYIAAGHRGVLVLDPETPAGIREVSMKDGSVFSAVSFLGTSYSLEDGPEGMEIRGFRMQGEAEAEILWADPVSGRGVRETLSLSKMKKIPVVLQTTYLTDEGWLKTRAGEFNRSNGSYQVIVEYGDGSDQVERGTRMALQIAAGKGPDILYGYALDFVPDLAEKGGLEDLVPYMEADGIREEDYFPYAFDYLRNGEKIYTFRLAGIPSFTCFHKELLGGREVSDIDALLDALLDWEGEAFFQTFTASTSVLNFLWGSGSEMIDWENGTCDFSGERFAKMLQVAKKYGVTYRKALEGDFPTGQLYAIEIISCSFYGYKTSAELEEMGLVKWGALLGGDAYPGIGGADSVLAVNANSAQKEGAWEFIRYLMSEEVQSTFTDGKMTNKVAHKKWVENKLAIIQTLKGFVGGGDTSTRILANGETIVEQEKAYRKEDITQERVDEYLEALENTSGGSLSTKMLKQLEAIKKIIDEEAEYYFEDVKSLEEVVDIINSRVGVYLGEQN